MGNCPARARYVNSREVCTQTTHAYNCQFSRMNRYYDYVGPLVSIEAPATTRITSGYVRDAAIQGPTTCIHAVEFGEFQGVGSPTIGRITPLPRDKFHAIGTDIRPR